MNIWQCWVERRRVMRERRLRRDAAAHEAWIQSQYKMGRTFYPLEWADRHAKLAVIKEELRELEQ